MTVGWDQPLETPTPTLAEYLAGRGYRTGGFVANVLYCGAQSNLDRGFSRYEDYPVSVGQVVKSSSLGLFVINSEPFRDLTNWHTIGRVLAPEINERFLDWLAEGDDRPFFVFLNYFDAHMPYIAPAPFDARFGATPLRDPRIQNRRYTAEEAAEMRDAYDEGIAYLDDQVGRLFDELDRRGVLERTIVVITSDHGEEFGEHGITGHGASQYVPVLHVPLIVIVPDSAAMGTRVRRFVSLRDVPATIERLVTATAGELPGHSLRPLWSGDSLAPISPVFSDVQRLATLPGRYPTSQHAIQSLIVEDRWHLIRPEGGAAELYDLATDSLETHNLAGDPTHGIRLRAMTDSVTRLRGR
jgi:arylsulfatase A-like enzyme